MPTQFTMTCSQDLYYVITRMDILRTERLGGRKIPFRILSLSCNPSCNLTSCSYSLLRVANRHSTSYIFNLQRILDLTHVKKMMSVLFSLSILDTSLPLLFCAIAFQSSRHIPFCSSHWPKHSSLCSSDISQGRHFLLCKIKRTPQSKPHNIPPLQTQQLTSHRIPPLRFKYITVP